MGEKEVTKSTGQGASAVATAGAKALWSGEQGHVKKKN